MLTTVSLIIALLYRRRGGEIGCAEEGKYKKLNAKGGEERRKGSPRKNEGCGMYCGENSV